MAKASCPQQWVKFINLAVRYLNTHYIQVSPFSHNPASRRVFKKNGFVDYCTIHDALALPPSKGGRE
jgi:hypothetical protein